MKRAHWIKPKQIKIDMQPIQDKVDEANVRAFEEKIRILSEEHGLELAAIPILTRMGTMSARIVIVKKESDKKENNEP